MALGLVGGLAFAGAAATLVEATDPDELAPLAVEASETLTGLRFLQLVDAADTEPSAMFSLDGAPTTGANEPDVRIGWFGATYASQLGEIAAIVGDRLDVDPALFVEEWTTTDDRRMKAMFAAMAQLGRPYVWATSGPDSFDCSGLTMYAWGQADLTLDHYSLSQVNSGEAIDPADVQVGDLVHSPGHVMFSLGVGDAIIESSGGGVQLDQWGSRADAWTDPLRERTVSWNVVDPEGLQRGPKSAPEQPLAPETVGQPAPATPDAVVGDTAPTPSEAVVDQVVPVDSDGAPASAGDVQPAPPVDATATGSGADEAHEMSARLSVGG
jgi:hypothetical protein